MYEVDGEEVIPPREPEAGVSTPEPIKVTKVKKKKVFILSSSCWVFLMPCLNRRVRNQSLARSRRIDER